MKPISWGILILSILFLTGTATAATSYNLSLDYQSTQTAYFANSINMSTVNGLTVSATPTYSETDPYDIPTSGLVAHWTFDEVSGTTVSDSVGSNDGTAQGGMARANGKYNQAGSFDGSDDYVEISNPLSGATACTVIAWVNRDTYKQYAAAISIWDGTASGRVFTLGYENPEGTVLWGICDGSTTNYVSKTGFTSVWHMLVGTYDASTDTITIWIDLAKNSNTASINVMQNVPSAPTRIGQQGVAATTRWDGYIDNVIIYDRCLTDDEIKGIYYDTVAELKVKTDTLDTWSAFIYGGGAAQSVPFTNTSTMTGLIATIPDDVTIDAVTIYDYTSTVSPMTLTALVDWKSTGGGSGGEEPTGGETGEEYVDTTGNITGSNLNGTATEIQEHQPTKGNYSQYVNVLFQKDMNGWDFAGNVATFYGNFVEISFFWLLILLIPMVTMWQRQGTMIVVCVIYVFCGTIFAGVLPAYFAGAQFWFLLLGAGGIMYHAFIRGD